MDIFGNMKKYNMTREEFKEIINQIQRLEDYSDKYYKFGIDLFEGEYPILDATYTTIRLLFESIYTEEGYEWIEWFCYENDFGNHKLEAHDEEGNLICQTVDQLFDLLEEYKK